MAAPQKMVFGPYIRFNSYWPEDNKWTCSVMAVVHKSVSVQPRLLLKDGQQQPQFPGILLDNYGDFNFWRFDIDTVLLGTERLVHHFLDLGAGASAGQEWHSVVLPAAGQPWHWGFVSGAAFSSGRAPAAEWGGSAPVWQSLLHSNAQRPLHALLRGGSQINGDAVFETPELSQWAKLPSRAEREAAPLSAEAASAAADTYFQLYTQRFDEEGVRDALACIPQVNIWDDEDIFTLWGSFPTGMQRSPVFRGLFDVAKRFYLLFQHHTTGAEAARRRTFLCDTNLSYMKQLGPETAVVAIDARSERTRERVLDTPSWMEVFHRVGGLPRSIRHVIVMLPPPLHYPSVPLGDRAAMATSRFVQWDRGAALTNLLRKSGPHPEQGLDEAVDQWAASGHWQERRRVLEQFQALTGENDMRVTFLCGGTGAAGVAQFYSWPKAVDMAHDHRFIAQIVAPPAVDRPVGEAAARAVQLFSVASQGVNNLTKEKMVRLFGVAHPGLAKLLPRRGWVEASQLPAGNYTPAHSLRPTQRSHPGKAPPEGFAGKAGALLGRSASLAKKAYREAKGETVMEEEDRVVVLPPCPGAIIFTLHLELAPGQSAETDSYDFVVPPFQGSLSPGQMPGFQRPSFGSGGAAASPTPQHSGASPAAPAPAPQQPQHAAPPPSGMAPSWSAPAPEPYHVPMTYAEVDGTSAGSGAAASGGQQQPQQPRWQHAAAAAAPGRQPLASVSPLGGQQQGPPFRQQTTPANTATVGSSPVGGRPGCVAVSSDPFDMSAQAPPLNAEAGQQKHSAAFHALYGGGPAALDGGGAPQPAVSPAQQSSDPFQPGGGSAAGGQSQHGHHGFGGQPIYGRHPAEPSGDDPFQPGGAARGGGASVQYPGGIYGAQAAPSPAGGHGGGVWQPAYGNVPPAASAAGAGGGAEPKSYEKAYQQYLAQHPGGAGQAQGISGDTGPPSRPAHPPGGYADSPASVGYSGQQQGHQQQPQQSQQHQQLQQHPRPPQSQGTGIAAASGGAGAGQPGASAAQPAAALSSQQSAWAAAPAGTRPQPAGNPNTTATLAFLANLRVQDGKEKS